MKNTQRILMTAIAGLTATQSIGVNVMPVLAAESNAEKEGYKQELSTKEQLEQKITTAQKDVDKKEALEASAKSIENEALKQIEAVQNEYDGRNQVVLQNHQKLDEAMKEFQPILDEIANLEKQINESKKNIEEQKTLNEKASMNLEQTQKVLELKKSELAELQNRLSSMGDITDLTSVLENAKKEKENAESVLSTAQDAMNTANSELEKAKADTETKSTAYKETINAYNSAVSDTKAKELIVAEKQAIVDQFEDENGIENARAELEAAQADLVIARDNVTALQEAMTQAQEAYDEAVASLQSVQADYDKVAADLNTAQTGLNNAQQILDQAQINYDASQKEVIEKNSEIDALNLQIQAVQSEVDKAQVDYDKALNDYNSTSSPLEQAKKNLADFESKYATELSRLTAGSKGYFESIGCSEDVLSVFKVDDSYQGEVAGYTHMGQAGDATSLENMKASIPYLRECNEIRKKDGLPELSVSMFMMAIAQVNANYAQVEGNHSSAYGTCENLAWGYGEAGTGASPFRGWYDYEKKQYDAGNHKFSEVGHYLNIVHPANTITGFALQKVNGVYAQEFCEPNSFVKDVILSVDEFETSFDNYYDNLKLVEAEHNALKANVKNANESDVKDDTALMKAKDQLNSKTNELLELQNNLFLLKNEKAELETKADKTHNALAKAQTNVQNAKESVDQKKDELNNAGQSLASAKMELETKENVKTDTEKKLENANNTVNAIQNKIHSLKDDIGNWDANKLKAQKSLKNAQHDLKTAKAREAESKDASKKADKDFESAKAKQDKAQMKRNQASEAFETTVNVLSKKEKTVVKAQSAVTDYNASVNAVTEMEAEIKNAEVQINELKTKMASSSEKIKSLQAEIEALNVSLAEKKEQTRPYEQVNTVLSSVMEQGTKVSFNVEDAELRALLTNLAVSVDELKTIQQSLNNAKGNYAKKHNEYLSAKEELLNAKAEYNEVMHQLSMFLNEPDKKAEKNEEMQKSDSVNTGVAAKTNTAVTMAGLALTGMVFAESKRRKSKSI